MKPTVIGIKDLHRKLPDITKAVGRGRSFVVVKHAKPVFRIEPMETRHGPLYTLTDIEGARFKGRHKTLSQDIDRLVYGI
jgi:antitoxin (DNA-binding transcriptional repressor) of toxin-antitoxin stability system